MLTNSQPFPASYKWVLAEGADTVWTVTPALGQLGGPSTEEVTVRWNPKPNAPPGETEVSPPSQQRQHQQLHVCQCTNHNQSFPSGLSMLPKHTLMAAASS